MQKDKNEVIRATHKGEWMPMSTDIKVECYVLENGERVFSLRGTARTLGLKGGGALALPRMLGANYIQEYLSEDLKSWLIETDQGRVQRIQPPEGGNSFHAFKATLLVDLADAFYRAKNDGIFDKNSMSHQKDLAQRLYNITLAFSKVGINALIDEITGYQEVREKNELQKLLDLYVEGLFQPWEKRFPEDSYREIFRLKDWEYTGSSKRPQTVGKITNKFIYDFLPDEVMKDVREKKTGKEKLHQWLTSDVGVGHLEKQITSTTALMRASDNWNEFEKLFNRSFNRGGNEQLKLF
ncbi:P63C domain-containing protein [Shouchella lehensis]|uniref:Bacteriophage Mx8 p63 C-terminal domain-containing protein n=1 Tax=Shouchella lehensis G1 TaxID=1246626 RepID=A0A060LSG9_9BACI|nr:P63C domain-containing protein [Shouchella lehensis]AIC93067.1 hypothetical protein BleG1_0459 [Shouchella lehensis G1]